LAAASGDVRSIGGSGSVSWPHRAGTMHRIPTARCTFTKSCPICSDRVRRETEVKAIEKMNRNQKRRLLRAQAKARRLMREWQLIRSVATRELDPLFEPLRCPYQKLHPCTRGRRVDAVRRAEVETIRRKVFAHNSKAQMEEAIVRPSAPPRMPSQCGLPRTSRRDFDLDPAADSAVRCPAGRLRAGIRGITAA
jgi:hypothetical protein